MTTAKKYHAQDIINLHPSITGIVSYANNGHGPIGLRKGGIVEPIQPASQDPNETKGLGYNEDVEEVTCNLYEKIQELQENSETDSHEWERISEVSSEDKNIDVIHSYNRLDNEGLSSSSRSLEK